MATRGESEIWFESGLVYQQQDAPGWHYPELYDDVGFEQDLLSLPQINNRARVARQMGMVDDSDFYFWSNRHTAVGSGKRGDQWSIFLCSDSVGSLTTQETRCVCAQKKEVSRSFDVSGFLADEPQDEDVQESSCHLASASGVSEWWRNDPEYMCSEWMLRKEIFFKLLQTNHFRRLLGKYSSLINISQHLLEFMVLSFADEFWQFCTTLHLKKICRYFLWVSAKQPQKEIIKRVLPQTLEFATQHRDLTEKFCLWLYEKNAWPYFKSEFARWQKKVYRDTTLAEMPGTRIFAEIPGSYLSVLRHKIIVYNRDLDIANAGYTGNPQMLLRLMPKVPFLFVSTKLRQRI